MLHDKEKIKTLRLGLGISINELARRAGIRGPSMWAIEKGKTKAIKAVTLINIAAALGVPIQEILKVNRSKSGPLAEAQLVAVFMELDDKNKQAILAVSQSLLQQQKKT